MSHPFWKPVFAIGTRVVFTPESGEILWTRVGTVTGYSCMFPVFYIVQLDKPLEHPEYLGWTGVPIHGGGLRTFVEESDSPPCKSAFDISNGGLSRCPSSCPACHGLPMF